MDAIDISGLNFQQVEELRSRCEHRATEMRETGAPALREQWAEQAAAIGMTIHEIVQSGKKCGRGNGSKQTAEALASRKARGCLSSARLWPPWHSPSESARSRKCTFLRSVNVAALASVCAQLVDFEGANHL